MIHLQTFTFNALGENTYLLWDDTRQAVVIDCGAKSPDEQAQLSQAIEEGALTLTMALQTHAHFDHLYGASFISQRYGLQPRMLRAELPTYALASAHMQLFMHTQATLPLPPAGEPFDEGDLLPFGTHQLRVIATPGHTPGGVCFYEESEGLLLTGDSLFRDYIGRTDLPGSSFSALISALHTKIKILPDNVRVLPGHGEATTIGREKHYNQWMQ